ncbi:hypothetical protein GCM10027213_20460 [Mycobacterium bourgelatii]
MNGSAVGLDDPATNSEIWPSLSAMKTAPELSTAIADPTSSVGNGSATGGANGADGGPDDIGADDRELACVLGTLEPPPDVATASTTTRITAMTTAAATPAKSASFAFRDIPGCGGGGAKCCGCGYGTGP